MCKNLFFLLTIISYNSVFSQTNPVILRWLQNTTLTGSAYTTGNSTAVSNGILANCQLVQYNTTNVYISTKGIPMYPTGPFTGNPSVAADQNAIFRFPLVPVQNTGTATSTTGGNIGIFINGVALFDYRDGVSWNNTSMQEAGGPGGGMGDGVWNRDAILAEKFGFDCAKGHPAMGNYHHHQNPSAFKNDIVVLSTICNLYDSDGLYTINTGSHSPLLGFAYDGFPIYGAYAYANTSGGGGIVRMKSSYQLRNITVRTHYADGTDVIDGPAVSTTYPLGRYREDYEFISHAGQADYLDVHNGRFCITPEYPNGIYAYFCTVDENHNSAYPYVVGPTFYGTKVAAKVNNVPNGTTTYSVPLPIVLMDFNCFKHGTYVELNWHTASEINNSHFDIERSEDGYTFEDIGTVKGYANSQTIKPYTFIDQNPLKNISYYRLKQVDFDGAEDFSKVVTVNYDDKSKESNVLFSQNANLIVIQNHGLTEFNTKIDLFDSCGRLVKNTAINSGSSIAFIDTQTLYDGIYFVIIREATKNTTYKININN
jgi:hypothetical protein